MVDIFLFCIRTGHLYVSIEEIDVQTSKTGLDLYGDRGRGAVVVSQALQVLSFLSQFHHQEGEGAKTGMECDNYCNQDVVITSTKAEIA